MAATMQAANRLQSVLKAGKTAYGVWQMFPGANLSRVMARCGFDWVLVDTEHGNIDGIFTIVFGVRLCMLLDANTEYRCPNA